MLSISLRIANPQDAKALLAIYAPYVQNTAITFEYDVPTEAEFSQRIASTLTRYPYLAAEYQGEIVGYAYASPFHARRAYDWSVETSIYVAQNAKGKGVGKKLYQALESILLKLNICNLNACIAYPKEGIADPHLTDDSVRFHAHLGYNMIGTFHQCGYKFERWYDMVWMEKMIAPHLSPMPDIVPFPALSKNEITLLLKNAAED